jgi:hypothetical protein
LAKKDDFEQVLALWDAVGTIMNKEKPYTEAQCF